METRSAQVHNDSIQEESLKIISYPSITLPSSYRNVIIARWLRSLRHLNDYFKLIDKQAYFNVYEKYVKSILERPHTAIRLAVLESDNDVVFGWAVSEGKALHYVHVQESFRNNGIGKNLIPKDIESITHITKHWIEIWGKYPHVKFNPF